jgi:sugar lactone lactonase YvrE
VRRLAVVCAVAVSICAALVAIGKNSGDAAAARQSSQSGSSAGASATATSGIVSANKVSVVAAGIAPRALAAVPGSGAIDLTNATAPNQIFTVGVPSAAGVPVSNVRIAAVAGTGATGSLGDGGAAVAAQFDLAAASLIERSGIAGGPDGTLYVADTGNATIRAIAGSLSSEPGIVRSLAGRWAAQQNINLVEPLGIALDRAGNLYIADHGAGAVDLIAAGSGQLQTLAQVASPASVAVTPDGSTVYVASPKAGAVFAINTQTRAISAVSPRPPATSGFLHAGPTACSTSVQLCPAGLAVDFAGNLFIADADRGRILRIDAQTSAASVMASGLSAPGALAFDPSGNLYAAEQGLNRIVAFAQVGTSQGSISLSPASAAFGNLANGGTSATQTFTVSNTTASTSVSGLTIPKATTPADFTLESTNCTATLPGSSSCTLSVAFTPTATGARSATFTVTDANPSDSASTVLSGTGDDYELALAPGQLMSVSVLAGNAITMSLQVVPDNVFSGVVTLVCPSNLPTNTTCTFSTPTVTVSPGTPAPFQVTFQTTGLVNPVNTLAPRFPSDPRRFPPFPAAFAALLVALCAASLVSLAWMMRRRRSPLWMRRALPVLAILAVALAVLAGCKRSVSVPGQTPIGATNMVINGNSQNTSRGVSITLNVVSL